MKKKMTLGSLFDGSGCFPLAGLLSGIEPVWASEIEPFPVRVTTKRLPMMKHYGDVHKLSGADLTPVDIITFGSPCQSMSVAGKRAGIEGGTESALFWQAIRIIKEMRDKTDGKYPRYAVWENVTGSFSSRGGEDFKAILEAFIDISEPRVEVPAPGKNGWPKADIYLGDGWSVAYRTLNSQYWGVPQSRERIFLVADFAGESAGHILFESEGRSGYTPEKYKAWQKNPEQLGISAPATGGEGGDDSGGDDSGGSDFSAGGDITYSTIDNLLNMRDDVRISPALKASDSPNVVVSKSPTYSMQGTLVGRADKNGPRGMGVREDVSFTLTAMDRHLVSAPVYAASHGGYQANFSERAVGALTASDKKDPPHVAVPAQDGEYVIRRFTPVECARLQGFPDWWCSDLETPEPTDDDMIFWREIFEDHRVAMGGVKPKTDVQIKKWLQAPYSDGAAYKMWGNGMTLPCVHFVLAGVAWGANLPIKKSADSPDTPAPADICGQAAAVCTTSDKPASALAHAVGSGHTSVLEHAVFTFRVSSLSRAALAQLTRHRIASFDVQSQRYVKLQDCKPVVPQTIANTEFEEEFDDFFRQSMRLYRRLVDAGIPAEDARYITPQAVPTELIMTMNARELRHFFSLRTCNRAQWEIRHLADDILKICLHIAPELFEGCGPDCVTGACQEKRPCGHPRSAEEFA